MKAKTSAHYQQEFRKRLREQGLIKKEVWILPEHARYLAALERQLRTSVESKERGIKNMTINNWTTLSLQAELGGADIVTKGIVDIELIDGADASLLITMHDFGDLPVYMTVAGEQIIAESILWSVSDVKDVAGFNDAVLRTHKFFPLSTIGLESSPDGDYYTMFGALSSASSLENVIIEIETLASNVIQAVEAYSKFLSINDKV